MGMVQGDGEKGVGPQNVGVASGVRHNCPEVKKIAENP
jgi:hypothetical protein